MKVLHRLCVLLCTVIVSPEDVVGESQVFITPAKALVKIGDSLTLNCSTSCTPGKPRFQVMTDSVSVAKNDQDQFSIMELQVRDEKSFTCNTKCGKKISSAVVKLYYFTALKLTADPPEPMLDQQVQLKCRVDIFPNVSAELKLKRGDMELTVQNRQCNNSDDNIFKECEISAADTAHNQYRCEVSLQIDSIHRNESASLQLKLKEPTAENNTSSTAPPVDVSLGPVGSKNGTGVTNSSKASSADEISSSFLVWLIVPVCVVVLAVMIFMVRVICRYKKNQDSPILE